MKKYFIHTIFLFVITFLSANTTVFAQQKIIGPYLQRMSSSEVTICWSVSEGKTSIGNKDKTVQEVGQYVQHKSIISGLEPNKTYTYDVFNDGTDNGKGLFTTYPAGIDTFHFAVLGDTRSRHYIHQKIVNRIIDKKPLFVVNTGDLVANGNNMNDWEKFFEINDKLIRNVPYYTVLGNHEHNSENYFNFFEMPGNESYYFFTVGDALFVVLDMEGPDFDTPEYIKDKNKERFWTEINIDYFKKEKKWLENLLSLNNDAGYIFVFFHPTFYSIKKSRVAEAAKIREFWGDIFERHHVTAVFNGHDHYYHHAKHGGTHYIVTAGGGAPLYATDAIQPETIKYRKIEHFMNINVDKTNTTLKAIDINGKIFDKIIIDRRK